MQMKKIEKGNNNRKKNKNKEWEREKKGLMLFCVSGYKKNKVVKLETF